MQKVKPTKAILENQVARLSKALKEVIEIATDEGIDLGDFTSGVTDDTASEFAGGIDALGPIQEKIQKFYDSLEGREKDRFWDIIETGDIS